MSKVRENTRKSTLSWKENSDVEIALMNFFIYFFLIDYLFRKVYFGWSGQKIMIHLRILSETSRVLTYCFQ